MKIITTTLLFLFSHSLFAGDIELSYQENYPKEKHWYSFTVEEICKDDTDPLHIDFFQSEKNYLNPETGQMESVRIVHFYVNTFKKNCSQKLKKSVTKTHYIPVDPKRMTHVYAIYNSAVQIRSGH